MKRCPLCDSAETLKIKLLGEYEMVALPERQKKNLFPKKSKIFAYACVKCGHIFDLTLENPEKLAPFAGYNGEN